MVYHQGNYRRRFEPPRRDYDYEPPRRDYDYEPQRQSYYDNYEGDYNHAPPQVNPTSWNSSGKRGRSNFREDYREDDYLPDNRRNHNYDDYDSGEYDDYRRNYRSPSPTRRRLNQRNSENFAPNPSTRPVFRQRYNKPYQSSSSQFRRPNYGNERPPPPQRNFRNDRRYPNSVQKRNNNRNNNQERTPPPQPCNYIKFNNGSDFRGQKMQHKRIRSYYNLDRRQKTPVTTAGKPHSPSLPPPPPLPESEFMMTEGHDPYIPSPYTGPAYSSPNYSEDAPRSCSPVLEFSPDNTGLLEFTGAVGEKNDVEAELE